MKRMVLCIRKEATGRELLTEALRACGFDLLSVSDADSLSGLPTEPAPTAILADPCYMEDAARLRDKLKERTERHLPLLVIGDDTALQVRLSALRHGADAFFPPTV